MSSGAAGKRTWASITTRAVACCALLAGTAGRAAEPLAIRDQNPLTRGAYLPLPALLATDPGELQLAADLQWTNTVNLEATRRERMVVDEESIELDLGLARDLGPWRWRAMLPVINRNGGILDGVIERWHRLFGLPQGDRPGRPRNSYLITYQRSGGPAVSAPSGTALGDLALEGGRELIARPDETLTVWLGVEAPTGLRAASTGDGALDAAAWASGALRLAPRWSVAGRAGLSRSGGDGLLPFERTLRFATATVGFDATARLECLLQLDLHSAIARGSELAFLGAVAELTIGGRYRLRSGATFEAGVVEDVAVNHSPDVTFHLGWRWPTGRSAP